MEKLYKRIAELESENQSLKNEILKKQTHVELVLNEKLDIEHKFKDAVTLWTGAKKEYETDIMQLQEEVYHYLSIADLI